MQSVQLKFSSTQRPISWTIANHNLDCDRGDRLEVAGLTVRPSDESRTTAFSPDDSFRGKSGRRRLRSTVHVDGSTMVGAAVPGSLNSCGHLGSARTVRTLTAPCCDDPLGWVGIEREWV